MILFVFSHVISFGEKAYLIFVCLSKRHFNVD